MKTQVTKRGEIERVWWIVDAEGLRLGRLSTVVAERLIGKHKPSWVPFLDTGDHVVVINAAKVRLSGKKLLEKTYRHHTGHPGGLREVSAARLLETHPERVVEYAVRGMLPKGPLGRQMFRKLKVYGGPRHPHDAQSPKVLAIPHAAADRGGTAS